MTEESKLIKTDSLGRVRVPKGKREEMLDAFEASSLSGAAFARQHGVPVMTFASWIQKRRRARGDYENEETRKQLRMKKGKRSEQKTSSPRTMNLIEVAAVTHTASPLEILLANGVKVQVSSESQIPLLKTLIRELSC